MEKLSSTTKGVCELENYHYGAEGGRPVLFHTWPTAHFCEWFFLRRCSEANEESVWHHWVWAARKLTAAKLNSRGSIWGKEWGHLKMSLSSSFNHLIINKEY